MQQTRIAIAEKAIIHFLGDFIGILHGINTTNATHQHKQSRFWQVKICH